MKQIYWHHLHSAIPGIDPITVTHQENSANIRGKQTSQCCPHNQESALPALLHAAHMTFLKYKWLSRLHYILGKYILVWIVLQK